MISFSFLQNGLDEESSLMCIKSQMPGYCVTLQNLDKMKMEQQHFYMLCQFVCKVGTKTNGDLCTVLNIICRENEHEFKVMVFKKLAERIHEHILHGHISVGNYLVLQRPTILYDKTNVKYCQIEIGQEENQGIVIWKSDSLYFIEPFLMQLSYLKGYRHILFYELDHTGSLEHAVTNLCELVIPYGGVQPLSQIAGSNAKSVGLATFIKRITPLVSQSTVHGRSFEANLQVKFDEILFDVKPFVHTTFMAFLFDELAEEFESAVNNKHIEPGDLVALIYPQFDCKTAAPINIQFPTNTQINSIVLKNQHPNRDIGSEICLTDINLSFSNKLDTNQKSLDDFTGYSPVKFYSFKNYFDGENAIMKINIYLEKYGVVTALKNLSNDKLLGLKNGIVLSYFLKLITPQSTLNKSGKVTLFLKEITTDGLYGAYFKLVLGLKFAKPFYMAVKNKNIIRGDIICLVNPVVWKNPTYISSEKYLTYVVELAIPDKQGIVVFKLREICKSKGVNLEAKKYRTHKSQDLYTYDVTNTTRNKSIYNEDSQMQSPELISNINEDLENSLRCNKKIKSKHFKNPQIPDETISITNIGNNCGTHLKGKPVLTHPLLQSISGIQEDNHKRTKLNHQNVSLLEYKGRNKLNGTTQTDVNSGHVIQDKDQQCFSYNNTRILENCSDENYKITRPKELYMHNNELNKKYKTKTCHDVDHFNYENKFLETQNQCQNSDKIVTKHVSKCPSSDEIVSISKNKNQENTYSKCKEHNEKRRTLINHQEHGDGYQHKSSPKHHQHLYLNNMKSQNVCPKHLKTDKLNLKSQNQHNIINKYKENANIISYKSVNPSLIPEECFFKRECSAPQLQNKIPEYEHRFSLLPLLVIKPSLKKQSLDLISGFCKTGCKQMYPFSSTLQNSEDLLKPLCPRCCKVLKLDFCIEMLAFGVNKLVTVLLHGDDAEKYLNLTCEQFLSYDEVSRELLVRQFEEKLEINKNTGKTIETTDVTYWSFT